jgi:hypothetical protein
MADRIHWHNPVNRFQARMKDILEIQTGVKPMTLEKYRRPVLFYVLSTAIPWAFWFAAACLSHISHTNQLLATAVGVLGVVGLLGPTVIAFWMIWPHADLRSDLMQRLIGLKGESPGARLIEPKAMELMFFDVLIINQLPCVS